MQSLLSQESPDYDPVCIVDYSQVGEGEESLNRCSGCQTAEKEIDRAIALRIYLVRKSDGSGTPFDDEYIDNLFDELNNHYSIPYGIHFLKNCVVYIDDDDIYNFENPTLGGNFKETVQYFIGGPDFEFHLSPEATPYVNLAVHGGHMSGGEGTLYGNYAGAGYGILNENTGKYYPRTIMHELGHVLGLLHTFRGNRHRSDIPYSLPNEELVNGSNCCTAGDFVCDTRADPNICDQRDIFDDCGWDNVDMLTDSNGVNYDRGSSFLLGRFSESDYSPSYNVYWNPDFPASDFTFSAGVLNHNDNLFLYGGIKRPSSAVNGQQPIILEFNSRLEFVNTTYFPCADPFTCQFRDLIKRRDGGYWGVLDVGERGVRCEPIEKFKLLRLDDEFNVVDSYTSPDEEAWHEGRIYEDEYGDVYLQIAEVEYQNFIIDPDDCFSTLRLSPRLMKLDSNLNRVWMKNLNRQIDSSGAYSGIAEILPASDGPGMVAVSSQWNKDTRMAHLIRFDTAGNKLWHRTYGFFDTTDTSVFVYDAKVANDGGYVMVGEVKVERTQENLDLGRFPTQQGWIMKVDENGCLIPGCGSETVITSIVPGERSSPRVTLYPNPVEDMLMFRLDGVKDARSVSGQIYDLGGKLVRSVPERRLVEDMTLMLDVDQLKAGIYFLHLRLDNGRVVSEKFVKR